MRAEQRHERALARLVFAGVVGCMTAGLLGWPAGLAAGAAVLAGHALHVRVRPGPLRNWRRGAAAERRTGRTLSRLDPAYFHVLHDRALPGGPSGNLDHLVVGHTGVYAILSRRWPWPARLRADDRLWAGGRPLTRLVNRTRRAAGAVAGGLAGQLGHPVEVSALVAVHGGRLPRGGILFEGLVLHRAARVGRLIQRQPVVFTTAEVAAIAAAAERVLPPMIASSKNRHAS